jgi:catechol 2,3-dioxygenase-like lactoylglutathione lyase family enzyme
MINGLTEIIIYVQDMETQVKFYREALGLKLKKEYSGADFKNSYWIEFETGSCTLALHGGGNRRFGEDSPKLVFGVDDIEKARRGFDEIGVKLGAIRSPAHGVKVCDGEDPEGNKFSIEERES